MRPLSRSLAFAAFVAVASGAILASADAPPDQYVAFGPTAQTIYDTKTKLRWQRFVPANGLSNQANAAAACANSSVLGAARLPTYRELLTLVDEDGHGEWDPDAGASTLRYIDRNAFPGTPAAAFWTMSPAASSPTGGFKVVDFGTGETRDLDQTQNAWVRCVSDN